MISISELIPHKPQNWFAYVKGLKTDQPCGHLDCFGQDEKAPFSVESYHFVCIGCSPTVVLKIVFLLGIREKTNAGELFSVFEEGMVCRGI